jgi:hypothetical protein
MGCAGRVLNIKLQQQRFGDAVLTPQGVLPRNALVKRDVLGWNAWTTGLCTRTPRPNQPIALPMPTNDRIWLDDDKRVTPFGPTAREPNPEATVFTADAWSAALPLEHLQRMMQRCDVQQKVASVGDRTS